jgi:hypothetical protein
MMPIVNSNIYTIIAAALCITHLILAAAAITFCILLFRCTKNIGWLFLSVGFIEPFYTVAWRVAWGLNPLWYSSHSIGRDGVPIEHLNFDVPVMFIFSVIGVYLLYRRFRHDKPPA